MEEAFWKQKAACRWLIEGERNTKFFHSLVKKKRNRSFIHRIMVDEVEVDNPAEFYP